MITELLNISSDSTVAATAPESLRCYQIRARVNECTPTADADKEGTDGADADGGNALYTLQSIILTQCLTRVEYLHKDVLSNSRVAFRDMGVKIS